MAAYPNPLSLSVAARNRIWALLQTELEARIEGKVVTGSGVGQSFSTQNLTWDQFMALYNSWSDVMVGVAMQTGGGRVRPNFSCRG